MSEPHALLMLSCAKGIRPDALADAMADAAGEGAHFATILPEEALPALAHAEGLAQGLPDVLATVKPERAVATLDAAGDLIDRGQSTILAFERHAILPGRDAIRLFFGLRRLPHLSREAFHDYWLNRHAEIGRRLIPPYSYHQLHAHGDDTARLASETGLAASTLDGVVEVHFPDTDAFTRQLSRPEVAQEALEDEKNFIDHDRSQFWGYAERPVSGSRAKG